VDQNTVLIKYYVLVSQFGSTSTNILFERFLPNRTYMINEYAYF